VLIVDWLSLKLDHTPHLTLGRKKRRRRRRRRTRRGRTRGRTRNIPLRNILSDKILTIESLNENTNETYQLTE